jgi:uncharacterized protein
MLENLTEQLKDAMRAKDELSLTVIRGMKAAFINEAVNLGRKPDDKLTVDEMIVVVKRMVKQRKDAMQQFIDGARQDLADREALELDFLNKYLPAGATVDEIEAQVMKSIEEFGETAKEKAGQLVGSVMKALGGRADGNDVKATVERFLNK